MSKRSTTLASLAAELGVSRTTVSNAYNRPDQLAPATRERILAAAAARGYAGPDPTARSLRTRRQGSVGVLLTEHLHGEWKLITQSHPHRRTDASTLEFLGQLLAEIMSDGAATAMDVAPLRPTRFAEGAANPVSGVL